MAATRRGDLFDKRWRLMDDWATYCAGEGAAGGEVTPIREAEVVYCRLCCGKLPFPFWSKARL